MTTPRIYVGTYAKYNNGSIKGAWLDLDDYTTKEEFYDACCALHHDEAEPELMFQDWETLIRSWISFTVSMIVSWIGLITILLKLECSLEDS